MKNGWDFLFCLLGKFRVKGVDWVRKAQMANVYPGFSSIKKLKKCKENIFYTATYNQLQNTLDTEHYFSLMGLLMILHYLVRVQRKSVLQLAIRASCS